jgi:hypothetical protein
VGVEGDKPSNIDLSRSDMHRSPAGTVVRLPNPSYSHATTGGRHQQLFYRFICFTATSYHDYRRLPNHATRSRLGCLHLPMAEEEGADIYSTTGSDERELRLGSLGSSLSGEKPAPRAADCDRARAGIPAGPKNPRTGTHQSQNESGLTSLLRSTQNVPRGT